jgi:hypothetical protein
MVALRKTKPGHFLDLNGGAEAPDPGPGEASAAPASMPTVAEGRAVNRARYLPKTNRT